VAEAATAETSAKETETLTEALLGREILNARFWGKIRDWPAELRTTLVAVAFAGVVFLPYLGAVGLWDPWETHYGEVAREMIQRNDYVHPYWENAYFFSKPAFTMWMQATGLRAAEIGSPLALVLGLMFAALGAALYVGRLGRPSPVKELWGVLFAAAGLFSLVLFVWSQTVSLPWKFAGVTEGDGALPIFTEWGFRLPFALFSMLAVGLLTYALTVAVSARAGLAAAFVLVTMPIYFLMSRQGVTDPPLISATIAGVACAMVGMYDKRTRYRSEWWYASYVFFGIATLSKELIGFGIPMVVFALYAGIAIIDWSSASIRAHVEWARRHLARPMGIGLVAGVIVGIIASSIGTQWATTFMSIPHDGIVQLSALAPAGFLRSLWASLLRPLETAPAWLGIMWGSLTFWAVTTIVLGLDHKKLTERPPSLFALAFEMRLGTGLLLFLAVTLPWYYEMFTFWRVDDESKQFWFRLLIHDNFARLGAGVHTTTPGGGFTYFIEQGGYAIFPWVALLPGAVATLARARPRGGTGFDGVALISTLWLGFTFLLMGSSATKFHHYIFPFVPPIAIAIGLFVDKLWEEGIEAHALVLLFGIPLFVLVGKDLVATPKDFTDLFVYNYDRPYPLKEVVERELSIFGRRFDVHDILRTGMVITGVVSGAFALFRSKVGMFTSGLAGVAAFALWFNWFHWVDLSHHWTQRDQFWRYYSMRRPGEPIASFLMNWRGETFYSRNTVKQIKDNANVGMSNYAAQGGREWSLVEHNRLGILKNAVGADKTVTLIDPDLNVKFVLVTIE
jgi:4-amino-4-deoxy-L-arabinose transferase-like glycosyltransferase